jgi:DNA-binding GntR family transcriptional regulator
VTQSNAHANKPSFVFQPVARRNIQKVSHLLAADLRRQILNGELAADQQLPPEADLTSQL